MKLPKYIISLFYIIHIGYSFNLMGIVYDNDRMLHNVSIIVVGDTIYNTSTNIDGEFFIKNIKTEVCSIKVSHIGYETYLNELNLSEIDELKIILDSEILNLDRIVVTGTRSPRHIKETPMLTHIIGVEDIRNSANSNVKDILEIAMPNVQMVASNHGDDRVKIQGLDNKYLTFLVDGDRVSGEYASNLDFSMLGLSNVDKIEVIEGAMSTLYGSSAIGGVVNIITKKNKEPYWFKAGVQYDNPISISPSLNVGFNKSIINYNLNIQYTESNGYDITPDLPEQYNMTLDENISKIFNHRLILSPSEKHNFEFAYKNYYSRINRYAYNTDLYGTYLVIDAPLNRYVDEYYKIKYNSKISNDKSFNISCIKEEYRKYYYYPYYYSDNQYILNPEEFVNGILNREEINFQYHSKKLQYHRLFGLEIYNENYSVFNIYDLNGELLQESIFDGQNLTKKDTHHSFYFHEERNLKNKNILSFGIRVLDEDLNLLPSLSYLIRRDSDYNYRISYSVGFRNPSIKERYYQWKDHAGPDILGNPNLKPTKNNYFSISLDKKSFINDFSIDFYRNEITNMISTEYDIHGDLNYKNYDEVIIDGVNVHYYRKITSKLKLKFVYNLTDASSKSNEILEGISEHAFRLNLYYKYLKRLDIVVNIKYAGNKFIFDQEQDFVGNQSITELSDYFLSDLYLITTFEKVIFKIGVKNIFNYKDPSRLLPSEILNNYDPGRRLFVELNLGFKGGTNDK